MTGQGSQQPERLSVYVCDKGQHRGEAEGLREALEFYGDERRWVAHGRESGESGATLSEATLDRGARARAALERKELSDG